MSKPTVDEIIRDFGLNPEETGNRPRGWWIIDEPDYDEVMAGAAKGDLCVKARDGAANPISVEAMKSGNCIGTVEDDFDRTYRYYYYRRLPTPALA